MSGTKIIPWRLGVSNNVAIGAASAQSAVFGPNTHAILISATSACHVRVGVAPTAVATDPYIGAGWAPLVISVQPGEKLAVIEDTAAGTLYVTELTH